MNATDVEIIRSGFLRVKDLISWDARGKEIVLTTLCLMKLVGLKSFVGANVVLNDLHALSMFFSVSSSLLIFFKFMNVVAILRQKIFVNVDDIVLHLVFLSVDDATFFFLSFGNSRIDSSVLIFRLNVVDGEGVFLELRLVAFFVFDG